MGNIGNSSKHATFEDIQCLFTDLYVHSTTYQTQHYSTKNKYNINKEKYYLINTLPNNQQNILIWNTLNHIDEEITINSALNNNDNIHIYIYGKNHLDNCVEKKYNQLKTLGFRHVYIYKGGLFEWLCLQDIYGFESFPTTTKELDILKFKPLKI